MTTTKLYRAAELAEASYADFSDPTNSLKNALTSEEFSSAQATEFVKHWKVAHHQGNTAAGYSATLFESLDNAGEFTFAIRGTEPLAGHPRGIFDKFDDNYRAQVVAKSRCRNESWITKVPVFERKND